MQVQRKLVQKIPFVSSVVVMGIRIGIDPGTKTGAYGIIDGNKFVDAGWIPTFRMGSQSFINTDDFETELIQALNRVPIQKPDLVIIEYQQAIPPSGAASMFKLGSAYGSLVTFFQTRGWSVEIVRPRVWKQRAGLVGEDKNASRGKAKMPFPDVELPLVKDHNKADALLIAYYGSEYRLGET